MIVELEDGRSDRAPRGRLGHAPVLLILGALAGVAVIAVVLAASVRPPDAATLSVPPELAALRLSVIPDRLLNDPPDARFRLPVPVRGGTGLGSVEGPSAVTWSEGGYWYELSSPVHTVAQLAELAGALR